MNWTKDNQTQMDGLRQKELAGTLTEPEQVELAENEELAHLLAQQEGLAAAARRFLVEFERRRASILDGLARFAGAPLLTT